MIIQDMQIMDLTNWPENIDIRFGETEVKRLCKRFMLNQENAINGMRQLIHDPTVLPKEIMPEFDNFYKTFPVSTAECERGFSLMNNICAKLRARLTMKNISNLMFININGPPLEKWDPKDYVKSWMVNKLTNRTSNVWKFFTKDSDKTAKCSLCQKNIKTSGNTSNLNGHLKSKHKKALAIIANKDNPEPEASTSKIPNVPSTPITSSSEKTKDNHVSNEMFMGAFKRQKTIAESFGVMTSFKEDPDVAKPFDLWQDHEQIVQQSSGRRGQSVK